MDLRTLFIAQTCLLAATAAMLWISRSDADRRNGMRMWTFGITSQALAYLLLSTPCFLPPAAAAALANFAGALGVALFFVAIRQFVGRPCNRRVLAIMVLAVTIVGGVSGDHYVAATIFNGFAYAGFEGLNAVTLWRAARGQPARVQRVVAMFYGAMALVLPTRAAALILVRSSHYLDGPATWQVPIFVFGFIYIVITNLGFALMCKSRAEAETRLQARTDELTGLSNRRALDEEIGAALVAAQRNQAPFAVVMADVDRFKFINDTFGHAVGDSTLMAFATRFTSTLRPHDRAFRYGGEEFCLLLPDTDAVAAVALAERVRESITQPFEGPMRAMTASFGIAVWQPRDAADAMLWRADQALYRAKATGRNRVELG